MSMQKESFTSRFGLVAATIGMAIGAGNIWRFPRLAAAFGGSFLIPWMLFLFIWSIPLLIVEFSIGKKIQAGTIGSFRQAGGEKLTWMGWFVGLVTTAILFYYSVVCGWSLKYFIMSVSGALLSLSDHQQYWDYYTSSYIEPVFYHLVSIFIGSMIIYRGIVKGVEKFSKVVVPLLFLLLIIAAVRAVSLPDSSYGIDHLFRVEWHRLSEPRIWIEGLTQSAWSTGAGWGLLLTYAIYARKNERIVGNCFLAGLGNNLASVIAGLAVIPTIFAFSKNSLGAFDMQKATELLDSGSQGLAFIAIPQVFKSFPEGGMLISAVFFLALFFAAMSSLISMLELGVRILIDFGLHRKKAIWYIAGATAVLGMPSAISLTVFNNQDWTWSLGLMISGAFFIIIVNKIGVTAFVNDWLQPGRGRNFARVSFKILFYVLLPLEFLVMFFWWWNPFDPAGWTTFLQLVLIILLGILLNKKFNRLLQRQTAE